MKNYGILRNIISDEPIVDEAYIHSILDLQAGQTISHIEITEIKESTTALVLKVWVYVKNAEKINLFIKTAKRNKAENVYHNMSMNECKFYKFIKDNSVRNLPIPVCYDVFLSEEEGEFVIVLEDVSSCYTMPERGMLDEKSIWFLCAGSLAKFHGVFWNHESIPQVGDIEKNFDEDREGIHCFINEFSNEFDARTKAVLVRASEINISLMANFPKRVNSKNNVTIGSGDSHIYNFMIPSNKAICMPLMIDFQFWGECIGTNDLSHLTRVAFSNELKKEIQFPLVQHYHKILLESGVTGYSWEDCFLDYRLNAVTKVLIPFYQYAGFKRKYEEWIGDLRGLVYNYEYLNGDELYRMI